MKKDILFEDCVREWYLNTYPEDCEIGDGLKEDATFGDVYTALEKLQKIEDVLGRVADTFVRERVFEKLAELCGVEVGVIMDMWMEALPARMEAYVSSHEGEVDNVLVEAVRRSLAAQERVNETGKCEDLIKDGIERV